MSIKNHKTGIYMIQNKSNSKTYIGQSTRLTIRWRDHKYSLRHGKHYNKHLQLSYDKYGLDAFEFAILEECDPQIIDEREKYWIKKLETMDPHKGYNMTEGGNKPPNHTGMTMSEEQKRKISEAHKGVKLSEEHCKRIGEVKRGNKNRLGKNHSEETKQKLREASTGNTNMIGKHLSEETKKKISETNKGRSIWCEGKELNEEHKANISKSCKGRLSPNKGKTLSEEHRKNLSESRKRFNALAKLNAAK